MSDKITVELTDEEFTTILGLLLESAQDYFRRANSDLISTGAAEYFQERGELCEELAEEFRNARKLSRA
jgi:hypothetical protein